MRSATSPMIRAYSRQKKQMLSLVDRMSSCSDGLVVEVMGVSVVLARVVLRRMWVPRDVVEDCVAGIVSMAIDVVMEVTTQISVMHMDLTSVRY